MAYLPELHYCCGCGAYLGPDNGDGICSECEALICDECGAIMTEGNNTLTCPECGHVESLD